MYCKFSQSTLKVKFLRLLPLTQYLTTQIKTKQAGLNSGLAFAASDAKAYLMAVDTWCKAERKKKEKHHFGSVHRVMLIWLKQGLNSGLLYCKPGCYQLSHLCLSSKILYSSPVFCIIIISSICFQNTKDFISVVIF